MKKTMCLLLVLLLMASTAFSESVLEYVSSYGLMPTTSDIKDGTVYCNYIKNSDNVDTIEWSDKDHTYIITDGVVLPVMYVNMLQMGDWELCNYTSGRKVRISYGAKSRKKKKCKTIEEYTHKVKVALEIDDEDLSRPVLKKGSSGNEVIKLQKRLIELHYLGGKADGDYGAKTVKAVKIFQKRSGMDVTGVADADTQNKIFSETAPEPGIVSALSTAVFGNYATSSWNVEGVEFTLNGNETKKVNTTYGTFMFNALGEYWPVG